MQVILPDRTVQTMPGDPVPIEQLLLRLGILPTGVIVVKNGRIVPDDVIASGDDVVRIIRVAHGG
jgi:sulfur carrier protein ThiS